MTTHLPLGALHALTKKYTPPKYANKKEAYICPECSEPVIPKQGPIKVHHYAHKSKLNCNNYDSTSESLIHKEAKRLISYLVNNNHIIKFIRKCITCSKKELIHTTGINNIAKEEYRFDPSTTQHADVGILLDDKTLSILVEVYNTHKTSENNRPNPWVELDAKNILINANTICDNIEFECIRKIGHKCPACVIRCIEEAERKIIRDKEEAALKLIRNKEEAERRGKEATLKIIEAALKIISDKEEAERKLIRDKKETALKIIRDKEYAEQKIKEAEDYDIFMLSILNETEEMRNERKNKILEENKIRGAAIALEFASRIHGINKKPQSRNGQTRK